MDETIGVSDENQNTKYIPKRLISSGEHLSSYKKLLAVGATAVTLAGVLFVGINAKADAPQRVGGSTLDNAHEHMPNRGESSPELKQLNRATVNINTRSINSESVWEQRGKGAVVIAQTMDGEERVVVKSAAHNFDSKKTISPSGEFSLSTPIRNSLRKKGDSSVANILPYVAKENQYSISVPGQPDITLEDISGIMVSTQKGQDEDLAIVTLKPGPKTDALRAIALPLNFEQPVRGDRVILGEGPDGQEQSGVWMGYGILFSTEQQSGFVDVEAAVGEQQCSNGESGKVFMTSKGVAPGTLYSLIRGSNPGDADKIADIQQATGYELPEGHSICHVMDTDYRTAEFISASSAN